MNPLIQLRLMRMLHAVVLHGHPHPERWAEMSMKERAEWEAQKSDLLEGFRELEEKDSWWSDYEYEWFINKCLDHIGIKR